MHCSGGEGKEEQAKAISWFTGQDGCCECHCRLKLVLYVLR